MKIGIIKETKTPPDKRVPLTPSQCRELIERYPDVEVYVQPDDFRAFANEEYVAKGIPLMDDLSECDILMGVKEVNISSLLENKTYIFFSHTAKKQSHNRDLLRAILKKKISLIDYEYLEKGGVRVVAFGRWAGIVGAYNGLIAYGKRSNRYNLKPAWQCSGRQELIKELGKVKMKPEKILVTGGGRVAGGAIEVLESAGIKKVKPDEFLYEDFSEAIYTQLDPWHYVKRVDGKDFSLEHFFNFPDEYESSFKPFSYVADILICCHYWDPRSPAFMTKEDMKNENFKIKLIADVSCDVGGPIPSTLRASTIEKPVYGYKPEKESEGDPWDPDNITVMAVDNLPGELPRDASEDFGRKMLDEVIPHLIDKKESGLISGATITRQGRLTEKFSYLKDYAEGKE